MTPAVRGHNIHGVILLDKPAGRSSNQALQDVKRLFSARKAGHTGSLDPFATGMLPICLGEATKTAGFMLDADKAYRATARLGTATATGDTEGEVVTEEAVPELSEADIETVLADFEGVIEQVPPMYSALKHEGKPLYRLAREGREVERDAREVTIHSLVLESWQPPRLIFRVECSKGTYVRTLAEDLAKALGSCAHLESLRRLSVTPFDPDAMVTLEVLEAAGVAGRQLDYLLPTDAGLEHWPKAEITEGQAARFRHGNPVIVDDQQPGMVRVYEQGGRILGIGETRTDNQTYPKRIFLLD
jgi:tRNA pseudouridine55 synthase